MSLHASSGGITFVNCVLWQTRVLYRFFAACSGANFGNVWKATRAEMSSGAVSIWLVLLWVCPLFKMVPVTVVSMYLLSFTLFCMWHSCESCWLEIVWFESEKGQVLCLYGNSVAKKSSYLRPHQLGDLTFKPSVLSYSENQKLLLQECKHFFFCCLNLYIYRNDIYLSKFTRN